MGKTEIKYIAIYGMADSPDSPSSVARFTRSTDPLIHSYEICNPKRSWFVQNTVARHFIGLDSGGYEISEAQAKKFIEPWRDLWPQPKHEKLFKNIK